MPVALVFALALAVETPPTTPPPVTTATTKAQPAPGAVKVADTSSDKVCKSEQQHGSRIATRVCRTKAEWAALELGATEYLRDRRELAAPGR